MVEIVAYKSSWNQEFREIASILRLDLSEFALRINHIGSTSVPGLAAKDVIDIQITVTALDQELLSAILAIGYSMAEGIWRDHHPAHAAESEVEWQKWFFSPPPNQRRTNIHVRV